MTSAGTRMRPVVNTVWGVLDSGFSALSTFSMGALAVRFLDTSTLALYSAFFFGWVIGQILPAQTAYMPSRLEANTARQLLAPRLVADVVRNPLPVLVAPVVAALSGLPLAAGVPSAQYGSAALAVAVLAVTSPHQNHARSSLHLLGLHAQAAVVSFITLAVQVALYLAVAAPFSHSPVALAILLGGLAIANLAGSAWAVVRLRHYPAAPAPSTRLLDRIGYLGGDLIEQVSGYVIVLVTAALLGKEAVAVLESARVLSSPVYVVSVGLLAIFGPGILRALGAADIPLLARRVRNQVFLAFTIGAIYVMLYLVVAPLVQQLLHSRADVALVAARAGVAALNMASYAVASVFFVTRRTREWNGINVAVNVVTLAVLPPALLLLGVYGMPVAAAAGSLVRLATAPRRAVRLAEQAAT